ncbi:MAG: hypothetical protein U0522_01510 [Candidatus Paceibacterota bacterium]
MKPSTASKTSVKRISAGQKEEGTQLVVSATRKAMGVAIDELSNSGVINSVNFQRLMGKGNVIVSAVTDLVKQKIAELAEDISGCLKLISDAEILPLDATDGKETISQVRDLFTGWIDPYFKSWGCDVASKPAGAANVAVHEMIKDGTFAQIFNGMSDDLDALCLSQAQIINFVKKHRKWLRTDGHSTFFLFKVGDEFFVADVRVYDDGQLDVDVCRFSDGFVWGAEYRRRVVVPQLTLAI